MYINSNSIIDETLSLLIANNFPPTPLLNSCFLHLTTILNNLITYPNEEKFRVIKKTNEKIAKELLIFPEAEQFLLILGFEEMNLEGNLCLFYAYGNDEQDKLENALKILKNKHKNEVICYLNSDSQGGNPEVRQEVNKRKKELEEMKETKENLIKEFEANKKYNIELKQKKAETNTNDDIKISNKIEYKEIKPGVKCPIVGSNNNNNKFDEEEKISRTVSMGNKPGYKNYNKNYPTNTAKKNSKKPIANKSSLNNQNSKTTKKKNVVSLQDYGRTE